MKSKISSLLGVALMTLGGTAYAQTISNEGQLNNLSTMPGSIQDFSFYGNPAHFPNDNYYRGGTTGGQQPNQLIDFTEGQGDFEYIDGGEPGTFSVINAPESTVAVPTGAFFGGNSNAAYGGQNTEFNAVNYTVLDTGSGFNVANFNVYVMFSNNPGQTGYDDSGITLTLVRNGISTMQVQNVFDSNSGFGANPGAGIPAGTANTAVADFAAFNVSGAQAGDVLQVGYVGQNSRYGYLGGISFESAAAPEPSTYALMGLGLLALVGIRRFRRLSA